MFLLKKVFGLMLMPMSILMVLFFIGISMLWSYRRQPMAKKILTIATLLFILSGYGVFSHWPLEKLENLYPPLDIGAAKLSNIKWIVVFGGDPDETVIRLVEGVLIYRNLSGAKLLVSGGKVYASAPESACAKMARMAMNLGVKPSDIVQENTSRDTKDEARIIKSLIGDKRFILVTSAYHMPRSMLLFMAQGMHPIPSPTGYLIQAESHLSPEWFFPSAYGIRTTELVVHEVLGIISAGIMGQLSMVNVQDLLHMEWRNLL
jgi:uncharacterized SAM-binding protein YcdF (DUF218 family)